MYGTPKEDYGMKKILALISLGIFLSGCATLISGKTQAMTLNSSVEGVEMSIVDLDENRLVYLGKTPMVANVPRLKNAKLIAKKEGFRTSELVIRTETNMFYLLNILGVYFSTSSTSTDYSSGALYKYSPNSYYANLEPAGGAQEIEKFRKESAVRVFVLMNYDRLGTDIAQGKGEYLNSLYELYNAKTEAQKNFVRDNAKTTHSTAASAPEFANVLGSKIFD
jgi:hypothetical protein